MINNYYQIFFSDLIGVCIDVRDVEVCCSSTTRTEIAKREILLIDMSMATVSFVFFNNLHTILYLNYFINLLVQVTFTFLIVKTIYVHKLS